MLQVKYDDSDDGSDGDGRDVDDDDDDDDYVDQDHDVCGGSFMILEAIRI